MRPGREVVEILTGAAALVVLALFIVLPYVGDVFGRDGYAIAASFRNVDGLSHGSPVRLAGVPIGTVSRLTFNSRTRQAIVRMRIADKYKLPADSAALIVSDSMLGSKYVKIEPGGDEAMLADGDEIEFVQNSVILENVLRKLIREVEASRKVKAAGGK